MRILALICAALFLAPAALAADVFVGRYESESRENFGSATPAAYRIEVASIASGKYLATIYRGEKELGKHELFPCPVTQDAYLARRNPGRAETLCGYTSMKAPHAFLSYVENGISVPVIKEKYAKDPEQVARDGLAPGSPELFELRHYKAQYYAYVEAFYFGFRKVSP